MLVLVFSCGSVSAWAIDPAKAPQPIDTGTMTEASFQERLRRIELFLQRDGAPPLFSSWPAVIPLTDSPALLTTNAYAAEGVSYVALALHLLNTTSAVQVLNPASVTLNADGRQVRFGDVPESIHGFPVNIGGREVTVEDALPKRPISLAPGKVTTVLMLFAPVETRGKVPPMTLQMELGGKPVQLDLNRLHGAILDTEITRIGPAGACAVVTIQGAIDGINAGQLSDRLNDLNTAGIRRFVIEFRPGAQPPQSTIPGWLASMAVEGEIGDQFRGLPSLPTDVAELHFTGLSPSVTREFRDETRAEEHDEIEAAVVECLWAPYRSATRRTVLNELEHGDSRGRAAALACGAHVYREVDIPKLSRWIDDPSRTVRQAACGVIARFDNPTARAVLQAAVRTASPRAAENALTALLNARSAANVAAGVEAASHPTAMAEVALLRILINSHHPAFADRIRQAARSGSKDVRQLALTAVSTDRSSEMLRIFEEAFSSSDRDIRDAALTAAAVRLEQGDQRLRTMVIDEALRRMRASPADALALDIAARTRDSRFVPLLAARISSPSVAPAERSITVERLTQIGGAEATDVLVKHFDSLAPMEQDTVLGQLWHEDPDRAVPFAEKLIRSADSSLAEQARQVLVHDGSDRSVAAIREAIRKNDLPHRDELLQALASIGTPVAYDALCEFRDAGNTSLRMQTEVAFAMYWSRSPAFDVAETAIRVMDSQIPASPADLAEALKLFEGAIDLDPLLPQIYRGRGNVRLRQQQWQAALSDFEAAMELNAYDEISLTGYAIALVMLRRETEALDWLSQAKRFFANNINYEYNTACAYSRALELRLQEPTSAEREINIIAFRNAAFEHLNRSIELGFGNREEELSLLQKDPDLLALHEDPRFGEAVGRVKQER